MLEVPDLSIDFGIENALLEVWYLVEAIHVKLSDERSEVVVFEPPG